MAYLFVFAFIIVLAFLIAKFADADRYAKMTDEEFEAESKLASKMAGPISAFQKLIDPSHHVEYVQKEKEGKPQSSQSGGPPEPGQFAALPKGPCTMDQQHRSPEEE
jgi:hypothetical protein